MSRFHIPIQAIKGRGVSHQQPHRFERDARAAFDDGWGALDEAALARDEAPPPTTQVTWEDCNSAITHNDSPDIGFHMGLNPYRGCEHVMRHCILFTTLQVLADVAYPVIPPVRFSLESNHRA